MSNKTGIELIAEERQRQIDQEGWTEEHDDKYVNEELSLAAASYAVAADGRERYKQIDFSPSFWPWDEKWWKPTPDDRIRELVKAGALIAADIDRLLREKEKEEVK